MAQWLRTATTSTGPASRGRVRCAIVTAKVDGLAAEQVAQALARAGVNVSTTVPEDNPLDTQDRGVHPLIRFSPHYYNTEDEIDRATELVAALATLPAPHRADLKPRPARGPGSDKTHPGRTGLGRMPGAHGTLPGGVHNGRPVRRR